MMSNTPSNWTEKALKSKAEQDEYVMRRSAELYPQLCDRYSELKELTKEIIKYYVETPIDFDDWHPVLQDAWNIVTEDGEI